MKIETFKKIEEAREYAKIKGIATHIIEIESGAGACYICTKCSADTLRKCKPIPEIKKIVGDAANLAKEKYDGREDKKQKNIPGLAELEKNIAEWDYYQEIQQKMMENEMNDGVNPPRRPKKEVVETAAQYPIAAAYVKADNWSMASHYAKSTAGSKAKKRIEDGEDRKIVIAQMEKEWTAHCDKNKWN